MTEIQNKYITHIKNEISFFEKCKGIIEITDKNSSILDKSIKNGLIEIMNERILVLTE